jgi:hypothetical protein
MRRSVGSGHLADWTAIVSAAGATTSVGEAQPPWQPDRTGIVVGRPRGRRARNPEEGRRGARKAAAAHDGRRRARARSESGEVGGGDTARSLVGGDSSTPSAPAPATTSLTRPGHAHAQRERHLCRSVQLTCQARVLGRSRDNIGDILTRATNHQTQRPRLSGALIKPSIGLEPMTPSLPWKCSTS